MKELLDYLVQHLVSRPEQVVIEETTRDDGSSALRLKVAPEDVGAILGRKGRTATALRTVLAFAAARQQRQATLEIQD